jgi:hypothetical protein
MPQLPSAQNVAQTRSARDPGLNVPVIGAGIGEVASDSGQILAKTAQSFKEAEDASILATATTDAKRKLKELEFQFEADTDFSTVSERFDKRSEEIKAEIANKVGSAKARGAFLNAFENSRFASEFAVRSKARERQVQFGQGQLTRNLDTLAGLMAQADNDLDRDDIKRKAILMLENAMQTGLIKADDQAKMELGFLSRAETVRAREDLQRNPGQFAQDILDPAKYPDIDEQRRQVLSEQADRKVEAVQRERIRRSEKAERDQEKAVKSAQEAREAELRVSAMKGDLTEDQLTDALTNRDIDAAQFDRSLRFLRHENSGVDDPQIALDLRLGIQQGTKTSADVMANKQNLTQETTQGLLDLADQVVRRDGPLARGDVKREADRIDQTIGGVRGPLAILDSAASERVANAMREYQDRVLKEESPREVADDVIERYRQAPITLGSLGRPQFWQGTTAGDKAGLSARLADAQKRTIEASQSGQIAPVILRRELQRLEKFKDVIDAMPDKAAK